MDRPTTTSSPEIILALTSADLSLPQVGGKARALGVLAAAGLPVPDGFVITTVAYRRFIGQGGTIPAELAEAIGEAYRSIGGGPVAVRSSATAEDQPDASFAGQLDSFLNVRGETALLGAVQACWHSLHAERALAYRAHLGARDIEVAVAVVVQALVDAEVSGILFTANPTTGDRAELVVNASFGLGEAVVGGLVTPDTYVLERAGLAENDVRLGGKAVRTVFAESQGTMLAPVPDTLRGARALSAAHLREIAGLGLRAEALFGDTPQDVEWALAGDDWWLLQSRPITNLPEPPPRVDWQPPWPGSRLLRRQVVENMPAPLSPLFEDLYLDQGLALGIERLAREMGLPFDIGDFIHEPMFVTVNGFGYGRYDFKVSWHLMALIPRILWWSMRALPGWVRGLVPLWRERGLAPYQATIERWRTVDATAASAGELLLGVRELALADAGYWFFITVMVGSAKVTEGLLAMVLSTRALRGKVSTAMFLRGFPSPTLDAQRNLAALAERARANPALLEQLAASGPDELPAVLAAAPDTEELRDALQHHLARYGHQVYNLDFVEPTQAEAPLPVLQSLRLLAINPAALTTPTAEPPADSPARDALLRDTAAALGPLRRWLFRRVLARARQLGPYREQALFYMGAAWPVLRSLALELGRRLAERGTLTSADAVFYLRHDELEAACAALGGGHARHDLGALAESRRALRRSRARLHPPGRVPEDLRIRIGPFDVTRLFETWETQKRNPDSSDTLQGFAVSPGRVTGIASVIRSPAGLAAMRPGTILVCPTTTPAWTPLFGQAIALVTDIGAVLAHGSIVAREYGIPAVLGTGNATRRLVSGQRITVDGDIGTVLVHDGDASGR